MKWIDINNANENYLDYFRNNGHGILSSNDALTKNCLLYLNSANWSFLSGCGRFSVQLSP